MNNANSTTLWQTALSQAITDPRELLMLLELDPDLLPGATAAAKLFPLQVPHSFIARMQKGNPHDPLLRQILPLDAELISAPEYLDDPLQEIRFNPVSGLLHKYQGRVLLTIAKTCAVNCRFCFRRHFPYDDNNPGTEGWERVLNYIAQEKTIDEVNLSGGDPLIANDKMLHALTDKLNHIPHVKRLRIHSRVPVVLPERITPEFIAWIKQLQQKSIMVIHANHPQEFNQTVNNALRNLADAGMTLLNQTVLLKGINDNADILAELSETLFAAGVQPYYLHLLDKVQGAAHFGLPLETAKNIYTQLNKKLSGYLVPRFVYEQPGAIAKTLVM